MANRIPCYQEGPCFARSPSDRKKCVILREAYPKGHSCPFQKPLRSFTNGVHYELDLGCCKESPYDTSHNAQFKFKHQ